MPGGELTAPCLEKAGHWNASGPSFFATAAFTRAQKVLSRTSRSCGSLELLPELCQSGSRAAEVPVDPGEGSSEDRSRRPPGAAPATLDAGTGSKFEVCAESGARGEVNGPGRLDLS